MDIRLGALVFGMAWVSVHSFLAQVAPEVAVVGGDIISTVIAKADMVCFTGALLIAVKWFNSQLVDQRVRKDELVKRLEEHFSALLREAKEDGKANLALMEARYKDEIARLIDLFKDQHTAIVAELSQIQELLTKRP